MTYPWNAGEVLAAADLNAEFASKIDYALTANAQSGTGASAYTFVLADASRLTTATGTSAKTFTIPPQSSVTWIASSIIRVANYGAGDLTIAGGSGVTVTNATKTLAQYESAALVRTGSDAWTLIPFSGGVGNADFSDVATGTYTDSGINYKYKTYTASSTITITSPGLIDMHIVGGGGFGSQGRDNVYFGAGGAGGLQLAGTYYLANGTYTVTVGGGGGLSAVHTVVAGPGKDGYGPIGGGSVLTNGAGGNGGNPGAAGGAGSVINYDNTSTTRAGGGGGARSGAGGSGGGGAGGPQGTVGSPGSANTGGGGGGGDPLASKAGGAGGSGIVIVRVRTN